MDPEKKRYYVNIAMGGAGFIITICFIASVIYEAFVIKNEPFSLFAGRSGTYVISILGMILLILILGYDEYAKWKGFPSGYVNYGNPPAPGRIDPASARIRLPGLFSNGVLNNGLGLFISLFLIGVTYAYFHSLPLVLIVVAIILVCYRIVRLMVPPPAWGIAFVIIVICVGFPIVLFGNVLFTPGLMPVEPIPRLLFQSAPFVYAILLLVLLLYFWVSDNGIPFLRPLTDEDLQEPCEEEHILSLPYDRVFERCREAVTLLPNYRIDDDEPSYGSLGVTVNPGRGRASTIQFTVETIHDRQTRVKISIKSPRPSFGNEPRTRTYVNEKYLQIVGGYLRSSA